MFCTSDGDNAINGNGNSDGGSGRDSGGRGNILLIIFCGGSNRTLIGKVL